MNTVTSIRRYVVEKINSTPAETRWMYPIVNVFQSAAAEVFFVIAPLSKWSMRLFTTPLTIIVSCLESAINNHNSKKKKKKKKENQRKLNEQKDKTPVTASNKPSGS